MWVKNKEHVQGAVAQGGAKAATCCIREVQCPNLEAALKLWIEGHEAQLQPITGPLIIVKAERLRAACNEIGVRLMVIWYSDRAWYELTMVVWYALVLLASRRVLLGACL